MNHYLTNRRKIIVQNNIAPFSKEWLSNFEKSNFTLDYSYFCVEQYMHAQKALLFKDYNTFDKIMESNSPMECLELGRKVFNYNDTMWARVRYKVVAKGTLNKYVQNQELLEALLSFDVSVKFVEASEIDCLWGCGLSKSNKDIYDSSKWIGHNLLGKIITNTKNHLIKVTNKSIL
jgi:hypothetical protein